MEACDGLYAQYNGTEVEGSHGGDSCWLVGHCEVWYVGIRASGEQCYLDLLGWGGTVTAPGGQVKGYMAISVSERHTAYVFRILDWNHYNWFIDPVSHHRPLKKGPALSYRTIFGPDISVCLGSHMLSVRGICTIASQRKRFVLSDVFFLLDKYNTRGDGARRHHLGLLPGRSLSRPPLLMSSRIPRASSSLSAISDKQMSTDPCMYSYALQKMYTYYCDVRTVDLCVKVTLAICSHCPSVWRSLRSL
jgi:hypothetical protein